jgi:hypothetical protein
LAVEEAIPVSTSAAEASTCSPVSASLRSGRPRRTPRRLLRRPLGRASAQPSAPKRLLEILGPDVALVDLPFEEGFVLFRDHRKGAVVEIDVCDL